MLILYNVCMTHITFEQITPFINNRLGHFLEPEYCDDFSVSFSFPTLGNLELGVDFMRVTLGKNIDLLLPNTWLYTSTEILRVDNPSVTNKVTLVDFDTVRHIFRGLGIHDYIDPYDILIAGLQVSRDAIINENLQFYTDLGDED